MERGALAGCRPEHLARPRRERGPYPVNIARPILCLLLVCVAQISAQPQQSSPGTRLGRLAAALHDAPFPMGTDFARCALQELAQVYADEARVARREVRTRVRNPDLPRWADSVEAYALRLAAIANALGDGSRVAVTLDPMGLVTLFVDQVPVVVSGPRISEPILLEERILGRFCALHPCDLLLAMHQPLEPRPTPPPGPDPRPRAVTTRWSFEARSGPVCRTESGLELHFRSTLDLPRKREFCTRLVRELHHLADALADYRAKGVRLDWEVVQVQPLADERFDRVNLNRNGEYLRRSLPTLAADPKLAHAAGDWLAARSRGETRPWVVWDAERLLGADTR